MTTTIIIPARFASTRLPGKVLLPIDGKPLVYYAWKKAVEADIGDVVVAVDNQRVFDAVRGFGGNPVMTDSMHRCGTDRAAEVAQGLDSSFVICLQADEPLINPDCIKLLRSLLNNCACDIATLATPIHQVKEYLSPDVVKVVLNRHSDAMYFSRAQIPYCRDGMQGFVWEGKFLKHIGVYAFLTETLLSVCQLTSELEHIEKLEQLRWLAAGFKIKVGTVPLVGRGIDTQEDYESFKKFVETGETGE